MVGTYWVSRKRMKPMQYTIFPMFDRNSEKDTGHRSEATKEVWLLAMP